MRQSPCTLAALKKLCGDIALEVEMWDLEEAGGLPDTHDAIFDAKDDDKD